MYGVISLYTCVHVTPEEGFRFEVHKAEKKETVMLTVACWEQYILCLFWGGGVDNFRTLLLVRSQP